jgi:hypothetical protein
MAAGSEENPKEFTPAQRRLWWLKPAEAQTVPAVRNRTWAKTRIDRFILARLEEKGIQPNPAADKITLLRRATLDITGLLPTPEETQDFVSDQSPQAWEKVVDRLLASPRYGERWARHWLDLAHYADSEGFKSDETRPHVWRYRDYVIRAFNSDKPYDCFLSEQIAGDEMFPNNPDALVATGFTRHYPDESNARNLFQRRQEILNDVTDTVGSVFLGLTFGCARCHDHKFDPILQKDYYRLQAFFAAVHSENNVPIVSAAEIGQYQQKRAEWEEKTRHIREEMARLVETPREEMYRNEFVKYPEAIQHAITTAPDKRTAEQWQMFYQSRILLGGFTEQQAARHLKGDAAARYAELSKALAGFDALKPAELPVAQVMIETGTGAPETHVLGAGAWDAPREEVQPGFLTIVDPGDAKVGSVPVPGKTGRRSALARWLTDPANPLTARVIVNRIWHHHFGRGIVGTPSDFGLMGERPTNRELLDDLAVRFVEQGWSMKKLHREILLSAAWRQSSAWRAEAAAADPDDKLLWRFPRRRLEGETIRDTMLQVSGVLNYKEGGPGVFPPMPPGVVTRGGWNDTEDAREAARRSVYIFVRRNTRYPMLETFDMPDTHESCSRRNSTITPAQALELMNDDLVFNWARAFAGRVLNDPGLSREAQIERAWRLAYNRPPTRTELDLASAFFDRQVPVLQERIARDDKPTVPEGLPAGADPVQAAVLVDLCHMLFASNEFVTLN